MGSVMNMKPVLFPQGPLRLLPGPRYAPHQAGALRVLPNWNKTTRDGIGRVGGDTGKSRGQGLLQVWSPGILTWCQTLDI